MYMADTRRSTVVFFGVQRIVYLYTMPRKTHKQRDAFVCAALLYLGTRSRQQLQNAIIPHEQLSDRVVN